MLSNNQIGYLLTSTSAFFCFLSIFKVSVQGGLKQLSDKFLFRAFFVGKFCEFGEIDEENYSSGNA